MNSESTGECVKSVAIEKESVNSATFQKEFSYFISNRNEQTLDSRAFNNGLTTVEEVTSDNHHVNTPAKNGDELIKTDFRPLVQIKTELYDDVSDDDDVPKCDVSRVQAEPIKDLQDSLRSDELKGLKAVNENAEQPHETGVKNGPNNNDDVSSICKDETETDNNDSLMPKKKQVGRKNKNTKTKP